MRNLICYTGNCFDAFKEAVDRKTDPIGQANLRAEYATLQIKYHRYDTLFLTNELENLVQDNILNSIEKELSGLYNADNVIVNEIRRRVQMSQDRSIRYKCQYCTIETANTMDHIVAQGQFPEFAIHPKNLAPSCGTCNLLKGERWRVGTEKNMINFYLDKLPEVGYLRAEIELDQFNEIDFKFVLYYTPGTPIEIYQLILSHFTKLHLRKRMREAAIGDFGEFHREMKVRYANGESRDSLSNTTLESCKDDRKVLGINHWKPVMKEGLINSEVFWNSL